MMRLLAVLRAVTVGGLLVAVGFLVRPLATEGAPAPLSDLAAPPTLPPPATASDSLATEVVLANVFAPSRTPPARRYTPPESGAPEGKAAAMADSLPDESSLNGIPTLYGTVVGDGGVLRALLHLDPASPGPRLYEVGARDAGYRVVAIAPRVVTLQGPRGRVVLRLPSNDEERP